MPTRKLLLLILFFIILTVGREQVEPSAIATIEYPENSHFYTTLGENSILPYIMPNMPLKQRSYASIVNTDYLFEGLKYKTLIKCLAFRESSYNPNAVGDNGQSVGCLQMYRWWEDCSFWQTYCVRKYGFDDVWNCRQQVQCADLTLQDDFSQIKRWSTRKLCGQ